MLKHCAANRKRRLSALPNVGPYIYTTLKFLALKGAPYIYDISRLRVKPRIAMEKAAFNKKRALFTSKMDLEVKKKLVKCYIWSIALYGVETWTLRAVDQKHLESF
jgi:hypothetical protein